MPGAFQIHFIYTGVAESSFLIYPDGTSLLLDCGDHPARKRGQYAVPVLPDITRHAGEWIARYVLRVNPNRENVDYMLLTHYHSDHGGGRAYHAGISPNGRYYLSGFGQAMEYLKFGKAIDRAWPKYDDPLPVVRKLDDWMLAHMDEVYKELDLWGEWWKKTGPWQIDGIAWRVHVRVQIRSGGGLPDVRLVQILNNGVKPLKVACASFVFGRQEFSFDLPDGGVCLNPGDGLSHFS